MSGLAEQRIRDKLRFDWAALLGKGDLSRTGRRLAVQHEHLKTSVSHLALAAHQVQLRQVQL